MERERTKGERRKGKVKELKSGMKWKGRAKKDSEKTGVGRKWREKKKKERKERKRMERMGKKGKEEKGRQGNKRKEDGKME